MSKATLFLLNTIFLTYMNDTDGGQTTTVHGTVGVWVKRTHCHQTNTMGHTYRNMSKTAIGLYKDF